MFKILFRRQFVIFCGICLVCCSLRAAATDLGDDLRSKYRGKQVMLRNFYCGKSLRFDEQGKLVSGGSAGPWTVCRDIRIEEVKLEHGRIRLAGRRVYLFYDSGRKQFRDVTEIMNPKTDRYKDLAKGQQISIEAALPSGVEQQGIQAALDALFYVSDDQFSAAVPEFWKPYLRHEDPFSAGAKPGMDSGEASSAEKTTVVPVPGSGPDTSAARPARVGNGVSAPAPIYVPDPSYSEEARQAGFQGTVVLTVILGRDGQVHRAVLQQPLGMGLDETAVARVLTWKFRPAIKDGKPVAVEVKVEVQFNLY